MELLTVVRRHTILMSNLANARRQCCNLHTDRHTQRRAANVHLKSSVND